jgi:hypothetical protein
LEVSFTEVPGVDGWALEVHSHRRFDDPVTFIDGPGAGFDFPGEMMCPDIVNQYCRLPDTSTKARRS